MRRCHSGGKPEPLKKETAIGGKGRTSKPSTPDDQQRRKSNERQFPEKPFYSNQCYLRESSTNKQRNISPDISSELHPTRFGHLEEPSQIELESQRFPLPKQRSRSTVSDRQPWGQLLNKHSAGENESVFGRFDPLRTLHFLARELQTHMQARLPEETNLQEIIKAMHSALKRIPPEVASSVQLQQKLKGCLTGKDSVDLIYNSDVSKTAQTSPKTSRSRDFSDFQRLIEGSTMKLEASCKQLEMMCGQLRDEKVSLEAMLQNERSSSHVLQRRMDEMEDTNKRLTNDLNKKDEKILQLKTSLEALQAKLEEKKSIAPDTQLAISDLKKSKLHLERENQKLEHQLRLCAIEKEKYLAILTVRDKQIYEIRNEMTQLQESVNEQLVELHNYATSSIPGECTAGRNVKNIDDTISSIWANDNDGKKRAEFFKDSESEDDDRPQNDCPISNDF